MLPCADRVAAARALVEAGAFHITCSLGVATFPLHTQSRDDLVRIADEALYRAKHSGRNRTVTA